MTKFRTWGTRTVAVALLLALLSPVALAGPQNNKQLDDPNNPWPGTIYVGDPSDGGVGKASRIGPDDFRLIIISAIRATFPGLLPNTSVAKARAAAPNSTRAASRRTAQ